MSKRSSRNVPESTPSIVASAVPQKKLMLRPLLWAVLLSLFAVACYWQSRELHYTELDDSIFISEFESYNRVPGNVITSFKRGVFSDTSDTYYRPLLLNSFVLDRLLEGTIRIPIHADKTRDTIRQYHITNIILHGISVFLLFYVFQSLAIGTLESVVMTLMYATLPVLMQAVVWIPGRNDTLLAVFSLSFLYAVFRYTATKQWWWLVLQFFALLATLFTKETGVIAAVVAVILLYFWQQERRSKVYGLVIATWVTALIIWFLFRLSATVQNQDLTFTLLFETFISRLGVLPQYIGKIFFPINLSVFPLQEDTSVLYGVVALSVLIVLVAFAPKKDVPKIIASVATFCLFLAPALIVPRSLNKEIYEHRLYVPIIGIFLLLIQTQWLPTMAARFTEKYILVAAGILALFSAVYINIRMPIFGDTIRFWQQAVEDSPSSSYAKMMLGSRLYHRGEKERGTELLRQAYQRDSTERYLNYYMGNIALDNNNFDVAEYHYQKELQKTQMWEIYFRLARIAFERKQLPLAAERLEKYTALMPADQQAQTNLLLLYSDIGNKEKARRQLRKMTDRGIVVDSVLRRRIEE